MKVVQLILVACIIGSQTKDSGQSNTFSFPPEWETHQAVWIDFTTQEYWIRKDYNVKIAIIKALQDHVPVKVLVESIDSRDMAIEKLLFWDLE